MKTNFHTHTVFCDGKNTPEEVVQAAIEKGFSALGFSGHGYTPASDLSFCMTDEEGYIAKIRELQERYRDQIDIYLGAEEDAIEWIDRSKFEYIIGSLHYVFANGKWLSVDINQEGFAQCLAAFDGDPLALAHAYYGTFCDYIRTRKPDIIGHFDLLTKFDELGESLFLENEAYRQVARHYIEEAAKSGCVFEVNTGAISRGMRTSPYPSDDLLHVLKRCGARLILSSDSHSVDTLDFGFEETEKRLRDIGITRLVTFRNGAFVEYNI